MYDRGFVWTWWAGIVPDTFGIRSVLWSARWGRLRPPVRLTPAGWPGGMPAGGPAAELPLTNRREFVTDLLHGSRGLDPGGGCA